MDINKINQRLRKFGKQIEPKMDIMADVQTIRVLYRIGVSREESGEAANKAARHLNPEFPGEIDAPVWLIGKKWCCAQEPECRDCPVEAVCAKVEV